MGKNNEILRFTTKEYFDSLTKDFNIFKGDENKKDFITGYLESLKIDTNPKDRRYEYIYEKRYQSPFLGVHEEENEKISLPNKLDADDSIYYIKNEALENFEKHNILRKSINKFRTFLAAQDFDEIDLGHPEFLIKKENENKLGIKYLIDIKDYQQMNILKT
jgi:hypothetical protein